MKDQDTNSKTKHRATSFSEARAEAQRVRDQKIRGLQRDKNLDRLRQPGTRRLLVVFGYLTLLAAAVLAWRDPQGNASVVAPLLFLVGLGVAFVLQRTIRKIDELHDDALDERLVAVRDAAFRRAYIAVVWGVVASMLIMMIGVGENLALAHVQALFYAFALGAILTPMAIIAWIEPEV